MRVCVCIIVICFFNIFFSNKIFAQNAISFESRIDQSKVALNDFVEITFTVRNAQPETFDPPAFNDFKIAGGPNQVTEMNVVNGAVSRLISYSYYLSPKNIGKFNIGAARMTYRGRTFQTKPLTVEITKAGAQTGRNAKPNRNAPPPASIIPNIPGFSSSKSAGNSKKKTELSEAQLAKGIFLRAEPSKKQAYIGEEITVEYKLYTKFGLNGKQLTILPQLKGFFPIEFKQFDNNIHRENVGGTTYAVQILRKVALYPQKTGELVLDPFGVQVGVIADNPADALDDPFGFMGAQMVRPFETESAPVKITVYDLPPGAPRNFNGAVGSFTFIAKAKAIPNNTDEPLHLELIITGNGDFKRVSTPVLGVDSSAFEIFEPKITDNTEETPNDIQGQKHYEYVLQPRKTGSLQVAPSFTYFDTPTKKYKTITAENFKFEVTQGKKPLAALKKDTLLANNTSPRGILRQNKTEVSFLKKNTPFLGSRTFWILFFIPFFSLAAAVFYKRILRDKSKMDLGFLRKKQAASTAQDRLAQARLLLAENNTTGFYNEIQKTIWGFLRDKYELTNAQLSKEYLLQNLPQKGVAIAQIEQFIALINTCEMATFAGMTNNAASHEQVLNEANKLINNKL